MKWGLSASNGLMASSKFGKNNLDGLGLKTETIPVVYPPVEIPPIDTEKGSELRVTYFGHLWQGRGILDLATAFSMIPSEVDARLVIAANNTHELTRSYLDQIIARSKISQNVTRLGVVKDTFREILIPSLIIALPYRDTPSIKLLEAMAAGRAVVTTKLGWSPEVIVDGENGFMVQVGNIKELANRLVSLLRDPSFARQIGERGQVTIRRMCDPGKHAEQVTEVLKSAAKSL